MALKIGDKAPDFALTGVDEKKYTLESFTPKQALAVVFSCNHCPYVVAYEDRMVEIQEKFGTKGFQLVAVNSNDAVNYPEDSFDNMKIRASQKRFPFPYLHDAAQNIARIFGATKTPHVFLFNQDRKLVYAGTVDDNWEYPEKVKKQYLISAIEAVLSNKTPDPKETFPVGCSIKRKH